MFTSSRDSIHKALAHPLRSHLLLRIAEEGQLSPNEIQLAEPALSLNVIAYHVKVLAKYGALELSETKQRRGATEHFYSVREDSPVMLLILASMLVRETLIPGSRPESRLLPLKLDRQGVNEAQRLIFTKCADELRQIESKARDRLEESSSEEAIYIHAGLGILANPRPTNE